MSNLWKLTPVLAMGTAAVVLIAGVFLALYIDRSNSNEKLNEVTVQAAILASTATAAISFRDRAAAQEYVNAASANPELEVAAIYEADGTVLAQYTRAEAALGPAGVPPVGHVVNQGRLSVVAPVDIDGKRIGTVLLRTVTEPMMQRVSRYGVIGTLVAMACMLLAVLTVAQNALAGTNAELARANAELAARARDLATANESLREQIEQRERIEEALRQSQKMEAIGQLTGGVAHDFNNLLQVITGNLERLQLWAKRKDTGDEEFKRASGSAMMGAQRAASLTQRLLAFSRRQPLESKPIDLNKLVSSMSDLLLRTLGETIRIETVLAGGLWRVLADENQLENAILNLAVNARDAMRAGGKLTIETANAHLDEAYAREEDDVSAGQYVLLSVSDTGSGMTKETLARVFEPFFTTKDLGHGTGLGLSMVYGFVKQTGGHIKLYSEVGEGTTVKLYLPRSLSEDLVERRAESRTVPAGNGETILVVEDEEGVRALTVETLRDLGYTVLQAPDGQAALRLLEDATNVRLLFTDVGLPGGMNGRQLADEVQRRFPGLKVLFTTGYARNAIVHQGRLDPGVELITKPFSRNELAHKIRMMLDVRRV
jgi:signal transduction histidine kinase